uniref:F5/8 type C domain-containing protein n=1 Tax=viral metagenome TaxID=1070528 RepID=A0A6M3KZ99_9ZZZZ
MTSNTTPKPYVTSAGYDTILGYAWQATTIAGWYLWQPGGNEWGWWIIDYSEEKQIVKRYGYYGVSVVDYPTTWYFYGSMHGDDWTQLDYKTGQGAPTLGQWNNFDIENDTAYRYYKLYIPNVSTDNCTMRLHFCGITELYSSSSSFSNSSSSSVIESRSSASTSSSGSSVSESSESSDSSP